MPTLIDVHAHVFNLGYVPVQGILESRGVGRVVARLVAKLLLDALERDESLPAAVIEALATGRAARAAGVAADELRTTPAAGDAMIRAFVLNVRQEFLRAHARDLDEALQALDAEAPETALAAARAAAESTDVELRALAESGLRSKLWRLLERVAALIEDGRALIAWFLLMLSRESDLATSLRRAWPESRLFVHHMMDLDNHYPGPGSLYRFVEGQIPRMRALVQRSGGRLLTFVAYDPFREDCVEIVRRALHDGCAGVKFYPPSGYRPLENKEGDLAADAPPPEVVDQRNLDLFRLCVRLDVPILAHCSPGGFESRPKDRTGCLSDPRGWEQVLRTEGLGTLRLCLGHAGGDEGWCAEPDAEEENDCRVPFVEKVIELCVEHPNVYCEFGHTERIFDPDGRANFSERLGAAVAAHGSRFARKCMYGSDWHLLARTPDFHTFDDIFRAIFEGDARLRPHHDAFFTHNALAYLNLPGYLERNDVVLTEEEKRYLRSLLAG